MFTQVVFKGHRDWNQFFQSTTIPGNWPNIYFLLCDNWAHFQKCRRKHCIVEATGVLFGRCRCWQLKLQLSLVDLQFDPLPSVTVLTTQAYAHMLDKIIVGKKKRHKKLLQEFYLSLTALLIQLIVCMYWVGWKACPCFSMSSSGKRQTFSPQHLPWYTHPSQRCYSGVTEESQR